MRSIAVFSAGADETARGVQLALERLGARVVFVDTSRIPEGACLSLEDGRVTWREGRQQADLTQVGAVYVKSLHLSVPLYDEGSLAQRAPEAWPARWVAERERHALLTSALRTLEARGVRLVNPVPRVELHLLKPLQRELLAAAGVPVPSTLSTNDPKAVRAFAARVGAVIYKPLSGGALVRKLTRKDLTATRLAALSTAPVTFQEAIAGDEWRVYVLGGQVVSAFHLPARGVVDARSVLDQATRGRAPSAVMTVCRRAARALELAFTAVDVRLRDDGRPVVLECNPTPSVAFYEDWKQSPTLDALARYLVEEVPAPRG